MLDTLGVVRPPMQAVLDRLKGVPVDIEPRFTSAAALLVGLLSRRQAPATTSVGRSASHMMR